MPGKYKAERSDAMLPNPQTIEANFGSPRAIMRDLGKSVVEVALTLVGGRDIPIFICLLHFLKDIGKDLLSPAHDKLSDLFRQYKARTRLADPARKLGRMIGCDINRVS